MKSRIYAVLILSALAGAANAQMLDPVGQMLWNRVLEGEGQQWALVDAYIQQEGETLWAEHAQVCQQMAGNCPTLEQYALTKLKRQAGIDPRAEQQVAMNMHRQFMQHQDVNFQQTQGAIRRLQDAYDRSNIGWQQNQMDLDQLSADRSAVMRGTWDYADGYSNNAVTLPHAPEPNVVYSDNTNFYVHNGYDWIMYDNEELQGPGTILQPLPNVLMY